MELLPVSSLEREIAGAQLNGLNGGGPAVSSNSVHASRATNAACFFPSARGDS